jgi:type IV secretion system protein VirB11
MLNSGHPGSITSVHADDAATIFWKLAVLAAEASKNATLEGTMQMVLGFIDVAVFVQSIEGVGRRAVEIHYI